MKRRDRDNKAHPHSPDYPEQTNEEKHLAEQEVHDTNQYLFRLNELDEFTVADYDPDVRGWKIFGSDGNDIGVVDELIADKNAMEVRYLEVELNDSFGAQKSERHILIPIGMASIDEDEDSIFLFNLHPEILQNYPRYSGGMISRQFEQSIRDALSGTYKPETYNESNFYAHKSFDPEQFYGPRRRRTTQLRDASPDQHGKPLP